MNFLDAFQNKTILIPMLQREYVQGGKEDVINPFLDSLIFTEEQCDLNYIYGYDKTVDNETCFIPVDGQQRLTTLWLLYTYMYAKKRISKEFHVTLKFVAREYAQDFCHALQEHLQKLLEQEVKEEDDLRTAIVDQSWFISSWYSNATVRNMLMTLSYIHQKVKSSNIEKVWERLNNGNNVSFAFLNMDESNGLDDDIYIKMNGRGRALSPFENLKSWIDEQIKELQFAEDWKQKMDNQWTQLFWDNRNRSQSHPEEIDDEQLFCFHNMLLLYHVKQGELLDNINEIRQQQPHLYEELLRFLGVKNEKATEEEVLSAVFKWIQKADKFSLIWIKRLNLMPKEFYDSAYNWMNKLVQYNDEAKELKLYIGSSTEDKNTILYQLAMCKGSFERTLPLLYALLSYQGGATPLFDWMRTMRNLILNTSISRENISGIMSSIDLLAEKATDKNIYDILTNESLELAFNKEQIKEEIEKATQESRLCYDEMIKLENGRFFSGCIGVLLKFLPKENREGYDIWSEKNVITYSEILLDIFNGSKKGINPKYEKKHYLLRRALMTYPPYRFGINKTVWCFCSEQEDWRKYIREEKNDSLRLLIKNILSPAYNEILSPAYNERGIEDIENLIPKLQEYVEEISKQYENCIEAKDDDNTYRFHFIHHPDVWSYMGDNQCAKWNNKFDIVLKHSRSNNSKRMELRTYCLYLDYKHQPELQTTYKKNGWEIGKYPKEASCFYFDKTITIEGKKITLRIDVYFSKPRKSENRYAFDMRVLQYDNEEKRQELNESFFKTHFPKLQEEYTFNKNGRLKSSVYSRKKIIEKLNECLISI